MPQPKKKKKKQGCYCKNRKRDNFHSFLRKWKRGGNADPDERASRGDRRMGRGSRQRIH